MTSLALNRELFIPLKFAPKEAMSFNGRLYFNMGNMENGVPVHGSTFNRRRGLTKHFSADTDRMRLLIDEGQNETWYVENIDTTKCDVWRDTIRCDEVDSKDPKRFELALRPAEFDIDAHNLAIIGQSYLKSILVDGFVVVAMNKVQMILGSLFFPTYTNIEPLRDNPEHVYAAIPGNGWGGKLYRLGKFVWATGEDQAHTMYDLLATTGVPFESWWATMPGKAGLR